MGLFGFGKKKTEGEVSPEEKILDGAENSDVIIPDHVREAKEKAVEVLLTHAESKIAKFMLKGSYDMGTLVMLSGTVESGVIKRKMKSGKDKSEIVIQDIKIGSESVDELRLGEEGSVFIKFKKLPLFKYEDVLEFK